MNPCGSEVARLVISRPLPPQILPQSPLALPRIGGRFLSHLSSAVGLRQTCDLRHTAA